MAKERKDKDLEVADVYSAEYLAEAAGGSAREERLAELKRRIALGAYKPDPESIAQGMMARVGRGDPDEDGEEL
jgi:anti-sigma28 factor (negative regulator of flagellin synthesis)